MDCYDLKQYYGVYCSTMALFSWQLVKQYDIKRTGKYSRQAKDFAIAGSYDMNWTSFYDSHNFVSFFIQV